MHPAQMILPAAGAAPGGAAAIGSRSGSAPTFQRAPLVRL